MGKAGVRDGCVVEISQCVNEGVTRSSADGGFEEDGFRVESPNQPWIPGRGFVVLSPYAVIL